jgi:hypothetical protein
MGVAHHVSWALSRIEQYVLRRASTTTVLPEIQAAIIVFHLNSAKTLIEVDQKVEAQIEKDGVDCVALKRALVKIAHFRYAPADQWDFVHLTVLSETNDFLRRYRLSDDAAGAGSTPNKANDQCADEHRSKILKSLTRIADGLDNFISGVFHEPPSPEAIYELEMEFESAGLADYAKKLKESYDHDLVPKYRAVHARVFPENIPPLDKKSLLRVWDDEKKDCTFAAKRFRTMVSKWVLTLYNTPVSSLSQKIAAPASSNHHDTQNHPEDQRALVLKKLRGFLREAILKLEEAKTFSPLLGIAEKSLLMAEKAGFKVFPIQPFYFEKSEQTEERGDKYGRKHFKGKWPPFICWNPVNEAPTTLHALRFTDPFNEQFHTVVTLLLRENAGRVELDNITHDPNEFIKAIGYLNAWLRYIDNVETVGTGENTTGQNGHATAAEQAPIAKNGLPELDEAERRFVVKILHACLNAPIHIYEIFKKAPGSLDGFTNAEGLSQELQMCGFLRLMGKDAYKTTNRGRVWLEDQLGKVAVENETEQSAKLETRAEQPPKFNEYRLTWQDATPCYGNIPFKGKPQSKLLLWFLVNKGNRVHWETIAKELNSEDLDDDDPLRMVAKKESAKNRVQAAITRLRRDTEKCWGWDTQLPEGDKGLTFPTTGGRG